MYPRNTINSKPNGPTHVTSAFGGTADVRRDHVPVEIACSGDPVSFDAIHIAYPRGTQSFNLRRRSNRFDSDWRNFRRQ